MNVPMEGDPLGTQVSLVDYTKFTKTVNCPPLEGITSSDTVRMRTVLDFHCSEITKELLWDSVFDVLYPNPANKGRWFLYHHGDDGKSDVNLWHIENNTGVYQTTPSRAYPLLLDSDNTIDLDTNRAILNGTTIPTPSSGAPYTKNSAPVYLRLSPIHCIRYRRAQIFIDDILVQDWRAATKNGKGGMYDTVSKTFVGDG